MNDLHRQCAEIFSTIMEVPAELIKEDTNPENLPEWDSLSHVQLIAKIEKIFSIEILPDEALDLESFRMVTDLIEQKLN